MKAPPCLRCGKDFERRNGRGRPAAYCDPCRPLRTKEVDAEQYRIARAEFQKLHELAESLREQVTPDVWHRIVDFLASLDGSSSEPVPLVPDRMPSGYLTNAGPDVGMSTTRGDLAAELDERRAAALAAPWWVENPHWAEAI